MIRRPLSSFMPLNSIGGRLMSCFEAYEEVERNFWSYCDLVEAAL